MSAESYRSAILRGFKVVAENRSPRAVLFAISQAGKTIPKEQAAEILAREAAQWRIETGRCAFCGGEPHK